MKQLREDYADIVGHLTSQGFTDAEIADELRRLAGEVSSIGHNWLCLPGFLLSTTLCSCFCSCSSP